MKAHSILHTLLAFVLPGILFAAINTVSAQAIYQSDPSVKIKIEGTSNIEDWEMNSEKGSCTASLQLIDNDVLTGMSNLDFFIKVEDFRSEHKAMDNNMYNAMNTEKYPDVRFHSSNIVVKPAGNGYIISAKGKLNIAGVSKDAEITANATAVDKGFAISGSYKLKMTDYNVTPPSIMFGAIKTGNDVTIRFSFVLKPR
jgi:polyisoprenoid-binding protein YceI